MRNRRNAIPGLTVDAERSVTALVEELDRRLRVLERRSGRAGVVSSSTAAKAGEFLNIEAPVAGLDIILPQPSTELRDARVTLCFRNTNPVRLLAIGGSVNRAAFVLTNQVGTFEAVCDGLDGWAVYLGGASTGTSAAPVDAEYLLGAAHVSLPNGRVATDSTEIDADLTVVNVVSWALRTASVVFGKLQDLAGLSVLGRASTSAGVMAAITATAGGQVLQTNLTATGLQWGNPVRVQDAFVGTTFYHTISFADGTNTTAGVLNAGGGSASVSVNVDNFPLSGLEDVDPLAVIANPTGSSAAPIAVVASTPRHVFRLNDAGDALEWDYPIQLGANSSSTFDTFYADFIDSTYLTAAVGGTAAHGLVQYSLNVTTLLAAIDSTSIVVSSATLQRAAITGAVAISQNANTSLFSGILNNGSATTDRQSLNFIGFTIADDSGNNRINITAPTVQVGILDDGVSIMNATSLNFGTTTSILATATNAGSGQANITHQVNTAVDYTWTGEHNFQEVVRGTNGFTSSPGAAINNLAIGAVNYVGLAPAGAQDLSGMVPTADGQWVFLENTDNTDAITILHDSSSSTDANRFYCPLRQPFNLPSRTGVWVRYNGTLSRWILAYSKAFGGLNVRHDASVETGVSQIEIVNGTGLNKNVSGTGTSPGRSIAIEYSVDESFDPTWTGDHIFQGITTIGRVVFGIQAYTTGGANQVPALNDDTLILRFDSGNTNSTIAGFTGTKWHGRIIIVMCASNSAATMQYIHASASPPAGSQLSLFNSANYPTAATPRAGSIFCYDEDDAVWRQIAGNR